MTMMMVGGGPGAPNQQNKFNTISNIHKRGAGGGEWVPLQYYGQGCGSAFIFAEPDPAVFLNSDPDPIPLKMQIRIQLKHCCKK